MLSPISPAKEPSTASLVCQFWPSTSISVQCVHTLTTEEEKQDTNATHPLNHTREPATWILPHRQTCLWQGFQEHVSFRRRQRRMRKERIITRTRRTHRITVGMELVIRLFGSKVGSSKKIATWCEVPFGLLRSCVASVSWENLCERFRWKQAHLATSPPVCSK